jgi:hypothetical protein
MNRINNNKTLKELEEPAALELQNPVAANEIELIISRLRAELNFLTKNLDSNTCSANNSLHKTLGEFDSKSQEFKAILTDYESNRKLFRQELDILALLPGKITGSVQKIVPELAKEIELLHNSKLEQIRQQFAGIVTECHKSLINQREELNHLNSKLREQAAIAMASKLKHFGLLMSLIAIFSIGTSALTGYLVATKYPRYVEIKGARDLAIKDSQVKVYQAQKNQ